MSVRGLLSKRAVLLVGLGAAACSAEPGQAGDEELGSSEQAIGWSCGNSTPSKVVSGGFSTPYVSEQTYSDCYKGQVVEIDQYSASYAVGGYTEVAWGDATPSAANCTGSTVGAYLLRQDPYTGQWQPVISKGAAGDWPLDNIPSEIEKPPGTPPVVTGPVTPFPKVPPIGPDSGPTCTPPRVFFYASDMPPGYSYRIVASARLPGKVLQKVSFKSVAGKCGTSGAACCTFGDACAAGLACGIPPKQATAQCVAKPLPQFTPAEDFPFDRSFDMANDLNGVTHDDENWYFTATPRTIVYKGLGNPIGEHDTGKIWKVPLTKSVNEVWGESPPNPWQGQFNHFGDLVHVAGKLFVALEPGADSSGSGLAIGVFDTDLKPIGLGKLPANAPQSHAAWVAFNPLGPPDGRFYSASFDATRINRFDIVVQDAEPRVQVIYRDGFTLRTAAGKATTIGRVQGGKFSANGKLYLTSDVQGGGIVVVNPATGRIERSIPVAFDPSGEDEELEGIDLLDLSDRRAPSITSQVHVLMVQNDWNSNDNFYFKHFTVDRFGDL